MTDLLHSTHYSPTDEEAESIEMAGVSAAWDVLRQLNDDISPSEGAIVCLKAFTAANAASNKAKEDVLATKKDMEHISCWPDNYQLVCSAMYGICVDDKHIHPRSLGGAQIYSLLKAAKAMEAMTALMDTEDDDEGTLRGDYLAADTIAILSARKSQA